MTGQSQREVGRRALLARVADCIRQTNATTQVATGVRDQHAEILKALETQKKRSDALHQWLLQVEQKTIETRFEHEVFSKGQSFWQRLRWVVTGRWPRPARHGEGLGAHVLGTPAQPSYAGVERTPWTAPGSSPMEKAL